MALLRKRSVAESRRTFAARRAHSLPSSMVSVPGRRPDLASEDAVADDRVKQHQREDDDASPQNMNARLECGAAASSMVMTKGIM